MALQKIEHILELIAQNKSTEALKYCSQLGNTNNADILQLQATCYIQLKEYSKALIQLLRAVEIEPHNIIIHNNLSNIYKIQGNIEMAMRHLNEALYINPEKAQTHHNLGNLYYKIGKLDEAIDCYHRCLRLSPNFYEAHFNLANCYVKQDKIFQAIENYIVFLKHNPNHYHSNLNLGMLFISLQRFDDALPYLLKALSITDEIPELHGHIADCYLYLGNDKKSIGHYEIVNQSTNEPGWLHNLAVLYLRNQQKIKAIEYFKKALSVDSNNYTAKHMINSLENNRQITSAPEQYTKALFDQYAWHYDEHMKKQLSYDLPTKFRHLVHENKLCNILDLGCGTGLCGVVFRDQAQTLFGIDLSYEMLSVAHTIGAYDCLMQANINNPLPGFAQDYFDIVLAAEVCGYIGNLEQLFFNVSKTLKNEGKFIFSIEISDNLSEEDFSLQQSGRFCHSSSYIFNLANKYNFSVFQNQDTILRHSAQGDINGKIFILIYNKVSTLH